MSDVTDVDGCASMTMAFAIFSCVLLQLTQIVAGWLRDASMVNIKLYAGIQQLEQLHLNAELLPTCLPRARALCHKQVTQILF
jgi:hypothetical protein